MADSPKEESPVSFRGRAARAAKSVSNTLVPKSGTQLDINQNREVVGQGERSGATSCSSDQLMKRIGNEMACNRRGGLEGRRTGKQLPPAV